jgi:hypothetical protein
MWRRHMLRQVDAALRVQRDLLQGTFDGDPAASAKALATAGASMEHLLAQPAVLSLLRIAFSEPTPLPVPLTKRERRAWARLVPRKEAYRYHLQS